MGKPVQGLVIARIGISITFAGPLVITRASVRHVSSKRFPPTFMVILWAQRYAQCSSASPAIGAGGTAIRISFLQQEFRKEPSLSIKSAESLFRNEKKDCISGELRYAVHDFTSVFIN